MIPFLWGESSQKRLVVTVLCIHKVKAPIGLKSHKGPLGLRWPNIGKLDGLWNWSCQPGQHLHLEAVWTRLPPEFVNVRANEPMKGGSCRGTQEDYRWGHCTFEDDIHVGGSHEGYDRTERHWEAASWERQEFYFLYGVWDWTMINNSSFFLRFHWLSSTTRSNANLVIFLSTWGWWCPSSLENSKMGGSFKRWIWSNGESPGWGPKTLVCWTVINRTINRYLLLQQ